MTPTADFPSKIQIQTVNRCNYLCPMCPYPELAPETDGAQLSEALYRRLIDEVRAAGRKIKLCLMLQNEPFLDKRFFELLDYAHRADDAVTSISTVTNGSLLDDEKLDRLAAYERVFLTISINATDRERYLRIHGRDFWDRVHGRLARWTGPRGRVRVSFVLDADSVADARRFQAYWQALGYNTRLMPINSRTGSADVARVHDMDESYGHCHYPVDTLNVLLDGTVILCCNDWRHEQRFGNLTHQTISDVWNGPELRRLRRAAIEGTLREFALCRGCDYPMRSSQRMRLEAMVAERPSPAPVGPGRVTPHLTQLRLADGRTTPAMVWNVDPGGGTVSLLLADAGAGDSAASLQLVIGHHGAFVFGALEPVWCRGTLRALAARDGVRPAQIELDPSCDEFRFLPWYYADWASA
jgi:hypothetical protein